MITNFYVEFSDYVKREEYASAKVAKVHFAAAIPEGSTELQAEALIDATLAKAKAKVYQLLGQTTYAPNAADKPATGEAQAASPPPAPKKNKPGPKPKIEAPTSTAAADELLNISTGGERKDPAVNTDFDINASLQKTTQPAVEADPLAGILGDEKPKEEIPSEKQAYDLVVAVNGRRRSSNPGITVAIGELVKKYSPSNGVQPSVKTVLPENRKAFMDEVKALDV